MGFIIPIVNRDFAEVKAIVRDKLHEEKIQKRIVLVIVAIALLLDNMLYMVIVPIMPRYLRILGTYAVENETVHDVFPNQTKYTYIRTNYIGEDTKLGYLFAIKAIVQLIVNPFSGTLIDRIGYEIPLIVGLVILFMSTSIFALGRSYAVLFFARSVQGMGSAFADTSGLAMIADRFTEEHERSKAMGIALAFISFGCLVAPPFGGIIYQYTGYNHSVPFMILSVICLLDGFMVFMVINPKTRRTESGERIQGTPIWRLFLDPYIACCSGALIMANVSLAFLEPTIGVWMSKEMPEVSESMQGLIWLPAFFPHVGGVYLTVVLMKKYPQYPWLLAAIGLAMEGLSCFIVPFAKSFVVLIIPLCFICFGIALIDTALLPMLGYLVDTRHVSVYGSVYAIADISYSLAYAFGPIVAGSVVAGSSFFVLNLLICLSNILYAPVCAYLRSVYAYKSLESNELQDYDYQTKTGYGTVAGGMVDADGNYFDGAPPGAGGGVTDNGAPYGYQQDFPQPEFPGQPRAGGARPGEHVTFGKTLYEKKAKKKNPGYRGYKDTDHILADEDDEEGY